MVRFLIIIYLMFLSSPLSAQVSKKANNAFLTKFKNAKNVVWNEK
jgi:hypothetical protein